jgi:formylglycine-generating enzyme
LEKVKMKKLITICLVGCAVLAVVNFASADIIHGISMEFVTVGNAGNADDTGGTVGCGGVNYNYSIGKYEVTNAQWNTFTAAAGAPTGNDGGYAKSSFTTGGQLPVTDVSWYEAAQFCNYLTSGDKSKGAYQFSGNNTNPGTFLSINRTAAEATYGTVYVIPTEDEWYKAAYHKNDGVTGNYWLYPTQSNSAPGNVILDPDPVNSANYYQNGYTVGSPTFLTDVGEFENSASAYGTFDQGGNVWEWNDTLFGSLTSIRGGSYGSGSSALTSSGRSDNNPYLESNFVGFRVAYVHNPEPATICLLSLGVLSLRRKNNNKQN